MFAVSDTVVAAIIGAVSPIILSIIAVYKLIKSHFDTVAKSMAEQNTTEHNINKEILTEVVATVKKIDNRLDDHVSWHLHAQPNVVQIVRPQEAADVAEGSK